MRISSHPWRMMDVDGKFYQVVKIATKQLAVLLFLVAIFLWPTMVSAQGVDFGTGYGAAIGLGTQDIRVTVAKIIRYALGILGIIVTVIIIYGGFVWLTAGGNEQKVALAKKIIINGVIGLIIIILAYALTVWLFRVILGGGGGGGGGACNEGEIRGCSECIGGTWVYNSGIPGCTLPGADFRVRDVATSHQGNDPKQNVNLCSRVQTRFSNSVDPDSVVTAAGNGELSVAVMDGTWQTAGNSVTFKHDGVLFSPFTDYQLRLPKQGNSSPLMDLSGLTLTVCDPIAGCGSTPTHFTWDFTTGNEVDEIAPYITDTYPVSDPADPTYPNRNVSRAPIFTVNFSESVDATTVIDEAGHPVGGNIILERLAGSGGMVVETIDNTIMTAVMTGGGFRFSLLDPNLLAEFTWYRLTVQNIEDLCGNPMLEPLIWEFQTNDNAPGVRSWYPRGSNACPNTSILITFGTSMFDQTVTLVMNGGNGSVYDAAMKPSLLEPGPYQVAGNGGAWVVADPGLPESDYFKTFEFIPTNQLSANTSYTVNIGTDLIININGDTLSHSWSFNVSPAEDCACAPYITKLSPQEGMAGQCITVQGRCFAGTAQNPAQPSEVTIDGLSTTIGGWGDNYLTTTVPQSLPPGTIAPTIVTITYNNPAFGSLSSNDNQSYYVNQSGIYDGPCLWSVQPDKSCHDANVTFMGERLGDDPGEYATDQYNITFTSAIRANQDDFSLWSEDEIKTRVPPAAVDGDVYATVDYQISNALPYDIDCGAGAACSSNPNMCDPNPTVCAVGLVCNESACICEETGGIGAPCDGDPTTPQCDPNNALCSPGLVCDPTADCTCRLPGGGGGGSFRVNNYWPSCNGACINSELGAKFSADVNPATLAGSLTLWQCPDATCTGGSNTAFTYSYNNIDFELYIYPSGLLNNSSYYRMILADSILSVDGFVLSNLNFDADGDGTNDSFSWKFSTNAQLCELTAVETMPVNMTFSSIGQTRTIYGKAVSAQQCAGSSYVNPWAYDWFWGDTDAGSVVTVANNDENGDDKIDPQQLVTAQGAGNSQVIGAVGVLSDSTDVSVVPGLGEDCDADPNVPMCQPDDAYCATFGLVCDPDQACTCQEAPGVVGALCDGDPNTPQCEPDASACAVGLVCDPLADCTCQEPLLPPPAVVLVVPAGGSTNVCRNTFVQATFNQRLDLSSINETTFALTVGPDDWSFGLIVNYLVGNGEYGCSNTAGCTMSRIYPTRPFLANTNIQVTIAGTVKNIQGTEMGFPVSWSFTTGADICRLATVEIVPTYYLFTQAGETHTYTATAKASNGQSLSPLPGVYNWFWAWAEDDLDDIVTLAVQDPPDASILTANPVNGRANITATAEISEVSTGINDTVGRKVSGYAEAETFICLYPWPDPLPWQESAYGFQTKYCRGNDANDLLGMLSDPASSAVNTGSEPDLVKEFLFSYSSGSIALADGKAKFKIFEKDNLLANLWQNIKALFSGSAQAQITSDVIGLRIYDNPEHLGPAAWYQRRSFPKGNPREIEVDGFPAIKDGNSIYITGAKSGGSIGTYIFVLSYNDLSSVENIGVFNQLIDNFRFYTFNWQQKPAVVRDLKRLAGATLVGELVENYKTQTGFYPSLTVGSYITGMSTSKWPSWQATLGNQLGTSLLVDPINKFTSYCSNDPTLSCWQDSDCGGGVCLSGCPAGFDPDTCWNEATQQFHCPLGSSIYQYRLSGVNNFKVGVYLEMGGWSGLPGYIETGAAYCSGNVYTSEGFCGDGIVQPSLGEQCEIGEQRLDCIPAWANWYNPQYVSCNSSCQWPEATGGDCGGYCGDGTVQDPPEVCDGTAGLEGKGPAICQNDCLAFYCQAGYALINGVCSPVWCDPNLQDCSSQITNGNGLFQTCEFTGGGWQWANCVVTGCDEGYHIFNNTCVPDGGGVGEPCSNSAGYCDPNPSLCQAGLECNPTSCLCYDPNAAPTVTILSPANNSIGPSSFTMQFYISQSGVYEVLLDGSAVYTTGDNGPNTYSYNYTNVPLGGHTLGVRLTNANGVGSDEINYTVTGSAPPAAPTGLTAVYTAPNVVLNWIDNSNDETSFVIDRSVSDPSNWVEYTTVGANVTTYNDSSLSAGNTYYYRVKARNANGDSAYTNTASVYITPSGLGTIFLTSQSQQGNLGAVNNANDYCQSLADASSLVEPGEWRAWISGKYGDGTIANARQNFAGYQTRPLFLKHGDYMDFIANEVRKLWEGLPNSPIYYTEQGDKLIVPVWTGTKSDGTATGINCNNWMEFSSSFNGTVGSSDNVLSQWTNAYASSCNNSNHLYCIWYDGIPPSAPPPPGPAGPEVLNFNISSF